MSNGFNPYTEWLRIPGDGRRPNHYQILGLKTFVNDLEEINRAAQEQIRVARSYQMGPQRVDALRIIGEMSEAFACLSDPESKRAYDQQLRQATTAVIESHQTETQSDTVEFIATGTAEKPAANGSIPAPQAANPAPLAAIPAAAPAPPRNPAASPATQESAGSQRPVPMVAGGEVPDEAGSSKLVWVIGGISMVIAGVVVMTALSFLNNSFGELDTADTRVPGTTKPFVTGANTKSAVPPGVLPNDPFGRPPNAVPDPSPNTDTAAKSTWTGRLKNVHGRDGEVHLIVETPEFIGSSNDIEAFSDQEGFERQVADYVADDDRLTFADQVTITGKLDKSLEPKYRVRAYLSLVKIDSIQRTAAVPKSSPQGPADHEAERAKFAQDKLLSVMRLRPPAGAEVAFTGTYSSCGTGYVYLYSISNGSTQLKLDFPALNSKVLADYRNSQPVEVTATISPESQAGTLKLIGKSIRLVDDPLSLITAAGRQTPIRDWTAARDAWRDMKNQPEEHLGKKLEMSGIYAGPQDTPEGPCLKLTNLCASYEELLLPLKFPPEVQPFLDSLKKGDDVLFEVMLTGGASYKPLVRLLWMSKRADPTKRIPFSSPDGYATTPGALVLRFKDNARNHFVAWSPTGEFLATGGEQNTVDLHDPETGKIRHQLSGLSDSVNALAFSRDGKRIAAADSNQNLLIWDIESDAKPKSYKVGGALEDQISGPPTSLSWSADDLHLVDARRRSILMWNVRTSFKELVANGSSGTLAVEFNPAAEKPRIYAAIHSYLGLVVAGEQGSKKVYRVIATQPFAPSNELAKMKPVVTQLSKQDDFVAMSWSPDGALIATATNTEIDVWDVSKPNNEHVRRLLPPPNEQSRRYGTLAWSPDGRFLAAGLDRGSVAIWDAAAGQYLLTVSGGYRSARLSWSADSQRLAVCDSSGIVRVWFIGDPPLPENLSPLAQGENAGPVIEPWVPGDKPAPRGRVPGGKLSPSALLDEFDENGDGKIDGTEKAALIESLKNRKLEKLDDPFAPPPLPTKLKKK